MKMLQQRLSRLKKILANQLEIPEVVKAREDSFEEAIKKAGFASVEEAKHVASKYRAAIENFSLLSGKLRTRWDKKKEIASQLPSGKVTIEFTNKKDLGRMRALIRLVAIENGYKALFRHVKGQPVFEKEYLNPAIKDDYNTMYTVKVIPFDKPKEKAFMALPQEVRRQLLAII